MVTIESIREQFDELGIEPSDEVTDKCIEICNRHNVTDPVEFVEQWMAYSVSKLNGAEPTVEYLRDMESHEYSNRARKPAPIGGGRVKQPTSVVSSPQVAGKRVSSGGGAAGLVIYNNNAELDSIEDDVLGSYGCITPKAKKPVSRLNAAGDRSKVQFSPASYSPISSKRSDQDGPSNSGNVVYTFGNAQLLKQTQWSCGAEGSSRPPVVISLHHHQSTAGQLTEQDHGIVAASDELKYMNDQCKYMYDSNYERVLIVGDRIYEGGQEICDRLGELRKQQEEQTQESQTNETQTEEESIPKDDRESGMVGQVAIHHVDYPSTDVITVMGSIVVYPERKDDRVAIVDFDEMTLRHTKLNFSHMKSWAVFPGETVVLEGVNPRGNAFDVRKIHFERNLVLPQAPKQLGKELSMVIASAPFTDKDDLCYEKLSDLLTYCAKNSPDVLILTGPFGSTDSQLFRTIAETYAEYFEKIVSNIMNSVADNTEVLIVANHDDIVSSFVFPTFPYKIGKYHKRLHFLPDPSVVSINGFEIGITTVDVIKDLTDAEVSGNPMGDKIKRAFNYLFHHKSFYPLNPPPEELPLDVGLLNEYGRLPRVPNMMICPGDTKCYVRDVNKCVCINPGHLSDHGSGEGTFARVVIHPPDEATAVPFSYVACQVVKS